MRREFEFLNLARFVAAIWVVFFHANIHIGSNGYFKFINPILNQGTLGMTVFFTLSGFVLTMRYRNLKAEVISEFAIARIARLYPIYLLVGLITLPQFFDAASGYTNYEAYPVMWSVLIVFIFLFALQSLAPALFSVWNFGGTWSLSVEAFFYSTFPLLRNSISQMSNFSLRILMLAMIFLVFVFYVLLWVQSGIHDQGGIFYVLPFFRYPEFVFGCLVYIIFVERSLYWELFNAVSVFLFILGVVLIYAVDLPGYTEFGFIFLLPISWIFVNSVKWRTHPAMASIFNFLGRVSYCVYMAQFATVPYFKSELGSGNVSATWWSFVVSTLALAVAMYYLVEKPGHAFLKKRLSSIY